jgi:hypothetical protein
MTTPVTAVPDASLPLPDPDDLGTWGARMAEMHRWMRETLRPGMNTLADDTYTNAMAAASIANFLGAWSGLTGALPIPASVSHAGKLWILLADVADVTAETPGVSASWQDVTPLAAADVVGVTGSTGSAKMPVGTTAQRDASPIAGYTRFNSTLVCNEIWNGTEWVPAKPQASPAIAAASGTAHSISGIPAYATVVELHIDAVSMTGANPVLAQAGTAAGMVVSGYTESGSHDLLLSTTATSTSGIAINNNSAANAMRGTIVFRRKPGTNRWIVSGLISRQTAVGLVVTGFIDLPGALDRVGIARSGTDNFDGIGSIWATWS